MAGFTVEDIRIQVGTEASAAKATDSSTQTSPEEVGANLTILANGNKDFLHIVEVRAEMAANAAVGVGATVHVSHRIRDVSDGEPAWTEFGQDDINTGNNNCSNNVYTQESASGTPLHAGAPGENVEVDFGLNVDSPLDSTHYCNRNREADWQRFRRINKQFAGQFHSQF